MFLENTLVHTVHFWLKDKADQQTLIHGLYTLKSITHIRDIHIGVPAVTNDAVPDSSYDASLLILFNDEASLEAYNTDPIHLAFIEIAKPICSKVVVQDSVNAWLHSI